VSADFVEPMLAELARPDLWGDPPGWTYERKLDGLRCVAVIDGRDVGLWSRNRLSFNSRFPGVVDALAGVDAATFDGELVAWDGADYAGFGALQQPARPMGTVLCVFDILSIGDRDTRALTLADRRDLLASAAPDSPVVHLSKTIDGRPADLLASACAAGWEGLVAKRAASRYVAGRSPDWRKLKCSASQELVIGGWTDPRGSRTEIGALLVGYHDDRGLRYAGKVGTGFTAATLTELGAELRRRERPDPPFVDRVREPRVHWATPDLVANVEFGEWTRDGRLRHPRFQGLRPDKEAATVRREAR
jgi:bifunctional non-homologous end joining protein LigD